MREFNQEEFNQFIIENGVVGFFDEPITFKSGRICHCYVNWRDVVEDAWLTEKLTDFVLAFVKDNDLEVDTFYGVPEGATKLGIITQFKLAKSQANFSKSSHTLAMGRAKPKDHGAPKDKFFVGIPRGKTIVIEDVTTTGGSLIETLEKLRTAGVDIAGVISLTNRMEKTKDGKSVREAIEQLGFRFYNMSSVPEILPMAYKKVNPREDIIKAVKEYYNKYGVNSVSSSLAKGNMADKLIEKIDEKKTPCIIGLDPQVKFLPEHIKKECFEKYGATSKAVAEAYIKFCKAIIDSTYDLVPAFKPNICFYEKYGAEGMRAFQEIVSYIKSKGCLVIEDAKRGEVGESTKAYAEGHLGEVDMCDGSKAKSLDVDILVVNPYLGSDTITPFAGICKDYGKGIFILVKTSNPSSGELQDRLVEITEDETRKLMSLGIDSDDKTFLYNLVGLNVNEVAKENMGIRGYSSIGAVVGATYPHQAKILRKIMPNSFFLVPGYGAQGGGAEGVVPCFNSDGYGAVVNSSRGIIYAYKKYQNPENFAEAARKAIKLMIGDIRLALERGNRLPLKWKTN